MNNYKTNNNISEKQSCTTYLQPHVSHSWLFQQSLSCFALQVLYVEEN
jgi:hypothetical protein